MRTPSRLLLRAALAALALTAFTAPAALASGAAPEATAAASCGPPPARYAYPDPNGSYSGFSATGASCATAHKVGFAFAKCRLANGPSGRCVRRVAGGWACREQRSSDPSGRRISGSVTCGKARATVKHRFEQRY